MIEWIGQSSALAWVGQNLSLFLLLAGAALVIAEAFAPGAHFMVLGVALLAAGLVGLFLPTGLGVLAPLILAGLVLVSGAAAFYVYRQFDFYGGKGGEQTSDSDSLRGEIGRVTERITATGGEVKLEAGGFNPYYRARSVDGEIGEGTEVMVVDPGGGNVITVEPVASERAVDLVDAARDRFDGDHIAAAGVDDDRDSDREFETDPA